MGGSTVLATANDHLKISFSKPTIIHCSKAKHLNLVSTWDWDPLHWTIFTNTHHMPNCFVLDRLKLGEGFDTCPIRTHHISLLNQASLFPQLGH